ncbi:MAG TPA: C45 family autoproteolytic acyltransferase/hydrolase [Spirochaetota bacterium]|nr:C45 family autoproteolytic acyltransferase/hydrolase [Spirochaetota bacterium]
MFFFNRSSVLQKMVTVDGNVSKFKGAELRYSGGYPVLRLRGSNREMGLQYGVLLNSETSKLYARNNGRKREILKGLPWYMKPAGEFIMAIVAGFSALRIPSKYRTELFAMSRGSGVSFKDMLLVAFGGVLFDAACISIIAKTDAGLIHAHNLDFEPAYLGTFPVIVEYSHPGKLRYMHLGVAGVPGMFHGMNEKGISVTVNYGDGTYNRRNKGLPMGYRLREILERAETLDDVERILHETEPDELGWIVTAASASEKTGAVFDIFDSEIIRTDSTDEKYMYVLNRIFSSDRTGNMMLSKKYLQISRGEGIYNIARDYNIDEYFKTKEISSVDEMIDFLRNYDFYHYKKVVGSLNATVVNERTLHTIIFDYSKGAVYLASAPGYSSLAEIMRYDFDTSELTTFTDPATEYKSDELRSFLDWYGKYQDAALIGRVGDGISQKFRFVKFSETDYSMVLHGLDFEEYFNPREIWSLFRILKRSSGTVKPDSLLDSCDKAIKRYPELAVLFTIRGNIEKTIGRTEDAIRTFEDSLNCSILSGYDRIHIYAELVNLYRRTENGEKALHYAELNMKLIDSLSEKYSRGDITGSIYRKMKSFAAKERRKQKICY